MIAACSWEHLRGVKAAGLERQEDMNGAVDPLLKVPDLSTADLLRLGVQPFRSSAAILETKSWT